MNKNQKLLSDIKLEIITNLDEDIEEYYGIQICVYKNIDEYLNRLIDPMDKIHLAQWANNREKTNELIGQLSLYEKEKLKYEKLKQHNIDLDETLNFKILSPKYDFIDDMLDMITTDADIQEQLLSLSDERLELFKRLYQKMQDNSDYNVPYITTILRTIGYVTPETNWQNKHHRYDSLTDELARKISQNIDISDDELEKLLFIYNSEISSWGVNNLEQLKIFGTPKSETQIQISKMIDEERNRENPNINNIKHALLLKTYGIGYESAKTLLKRYNISGLTINKENLDLFEMYKALAQIVYEEDMDILIQVYDEFTKKMNPKLDFMRITTFENDLRKEFAKSLNEVVFKTDNKESTNIEGIKVYDAGTDFKMIVTAIGACQSNFTDQANYSDYWNSPSIRSHGNCCSLIANNNLSMAEPKNIILGFSTMSDNMLLLCGNRDINSTPDSKKFNIVEKNDKSFMGVDDLINSTRGDYNELAYERRDLSNTPTFYKKNPDYLVFIEEYENIDEYLEKYKDSPKQFEYILRTKQAEEHKWEQTLKAAKDFGVPIVKVNRERCAKKAVNDIKKMVSKFEETKNPELISQIITQFENNRVGNNDNHILIRELYFSEVDMRSILSRIENIIINEQDEKLKGNLLKSYFETVKLEKRRVNDCKRYRKSGQTSSFDFKEILNRIELLSMVEKDIYSSSDINSVKVGDVDAKKRTN